MKGGLYGMSLSSVLLMCFLGALDGSSSVFGFRV